MPVVRELITKIGFDVQEAPLEKAENLIEKVKHGIEGLLVALAAEKLFEFFKGAAEHFDQVEKGAQRLGVTAENFQKIAYAAKLSDVGVEQFIQTMGIFSKRLAGAEEEGKGAAEAFKKVGIDPKKQKDQIETLIQISDKFVTMEDGAKKTALAMELFGKSGGAMVPFLNQGGEAIRRIFDEAVDLNLIFSEESVKAGAAFEDNLKRINSVIQGIGLSFASQLFPYLNDVANYILKWVKANKELVSTSVKAFADAFAVSLMVLKAVLVVIGDAVIGLYNILKILGDEFHREALLLTGSEKGAHRLKLVFIALGLVVAATIFPFLQIIALIGLFALAYDDLQHYLDGKPSLLGAAIDWLKAQWPKLVDFLKQKWTEFVDWIYSLGPKILEGMDKVWAGIKDGIAKAFNTGPIQEFLKAIKDAYNWVVDIDTQLKKSWVSKIPGLPEPTFFKKIGESTDAQGNPTDSGLVAPVAPTAEALQGAKDFLDALKSGKYLNAASNANTMLGPQSPLQNPMVGGAVSNNNQTNQYNNQVKIDVAINGTENPLNVGQQIADFTKEAIDNMLRAGQRATQTGTVN